MAQEADDGCTFTQGYWKTHNQYSKQSNKAVAWPIDEDTQLCGRSWFEILYESPKGDAWLILAHQYIAASLNEASGASVLALDDSLVSATDTLSSCEVIAENKSAAVGLSSELDDYNNGITGPGHCGDAPPDVPDICPCRCLKEESGLELPPVDLPQGSRAESKVVVPKNKNSKVSVKNTKGSFKVIVTDESGKVYTGENEVDVPALTSRKRSTSDSTTLNVALTGQQEVNSGSIVVSSITPQEPSKPSTPESSETKTLQESSSPKLLCMLAVVVCVFTLAM